MHVASERPRVEERILDDVEARLLAQGFRAMRVDALARELGISKRTLYEQFRSKRDMACAAIDRRYDSLVAAARRARDSQGDAIARLREVVILICASEAELGATFVRELETTPWLAARVDAGRGRVHAELEALIRAGSRAGQLRAKLDAGLARRVLVATVAAACRPGGLVEDLAKDARNSDRAAREAIDLVLDGLARRSV